MTTRLFVTVLLATIGLQAVFSSPSAKVRSGNQFCRELKEELLLSVKAELLTSAEAQAIHHRCLFDFGGK